MGEPRPIIYNLCFYETAPNKPAHITFEYDDKKGQRLQMELTAKQVEAGDVQVQPSMDKVELYSISNNVTILFLHKENQFLYYDWCKRQKIQKVTA